MLQPYRRHLEASLRGIAGWAVLWCVCVLPASGDWLVTLEGRLIETQGPWTIEDGTLTYTDPDGEEHSLDVAELDLEASEETTAIKAGKPYEPKADPEASEDDAKSQRRWPKGEKPKITLYMTSLCKECSRARELLEELDVPFIEIDVNTSKWAARKYRKVAGHGGGLPVIDVDGAIVFSNNPRKIRQRVREMQEREAREAEDGGLEAEDGETESPASLD